MRLHRRHDFSTAFAHELQDLALKRDNSPFRAISMALMLSIVPTVAIAVELSGTSQIVDGDTIEVAGQAVRLQGIDTAEPGQSCALVSGKRWKCGEAAMDRLARLTEGGVTCSGSAYDGYDRLLAACSTSSGIDIGRVLVGEGLAWAFRKYSVEYVVYEDTAKADHVGVWQADTQTPWDYRAERWEVAVQVAPDGCPIKGNISGNGRIYHPPWSPWYTRTKVSVETGERWFCTEREALDAGWRAPHWR